MQCTLQLPLTVCEDLVNAETASDIEDDAPISPISKSFTRHSTFQDSGYGSSDIQNCSLSQSSTAAGAQFPEPMGLQRTSIVAYLDSSGVVHLEQHKHAGSCH